MSDLDFSSVPPDQLHEVLNQPALTPPKGITPHFEHPYNEDAISLFALILCLSLASIAFLIRLYVKFIKLRNSHLGDYLMVPGFLFYVLVIEGSLRRIALGPGIFVHQWDKPGRDMADYLLFTHIGILFFCGSIMFIKSSILLEWLHLFVPRGTRNGFFWSCYVMLGLNVAFYVAVFIASNLACFPYRRNWDKTIPGYCIDIKTINLASAIINLILDLAILALPQKVIWSLRTSRRKKVGVSVMFMIGLVGIIAAAFRIHAVVQWIRSKDMTYYFSAVVLWATAEMTAGILIFCVPSVPKAFSREMRNNLASSLSTGRLQRTKKHSDSWLFRTTSPTKPNSRVYDSLTDDGHDAIHPTLLDHLKPIHTLSGISRTTSKESVTRPF